MTSTTVADSVLSPTSRLRLDGIGPVKVGMTLDEASRVTGKRLRVDADTGSHPSSCDFVSPPGGPDVSFMVIGGRIQVRAHPYDPNAHYLVYESPEPSQRGSLLIFSTDGSKVTSFRAGARGAVEAPEGCS